MDWSKYSQQSIGEMHGSHTQEEHDRAHSSDYQQVFGMAMSRFFENYEAFMKHYDDKDPNALTNFEHLFASAVTHAINGTMAQLPPEKLEGFDEISGIFAAAGFGFILGRTFQEFEDVRLVKNGDFQPSGAHVVMTRVK